MKAIIHANIYKKDEDALLIDDGIIQAIDSSENILKKITNEDELIDLKGAFLLPGFIDSHIHMLSLGYTLSIVSLKYCQSLDDIKKAIVEHLPKNKEELFVARGYNEVSYPYHKGPTKAFLDDISKDIPIVLIRACGHILVANTKALELAGITESVAYENGRIDYETGIVEEKAMDIILSLRKEPTKMELKHYLSLAMKKLNKHGITSVCSDDFVSLTIDYTNPLDVFLQESYQGNLTLHIEEQCEFNEAEDLANFLDDGYTTGVGDDYFEIGPLKVILDGSLGGYTAALTKPYINSETTGTLLYDTEDLKEIVHLANTYNMPTIAHAIGDKAVDQALEVFKDEVLENNPLGYGLVHTQILRKDQIDKIIEMKLDCYFQSLFIDSDASVLKERIVPELQDTSYPYKTLLENTRCANGSDAPVEIPDVLKGIYLAVTRKSTITGVEMNQNECLTIDEAISSYTDRGAEMMSHSDSRGKIVVGYEADLVVLDKDITTCPFEDILKTKVIMTIVHGEEVYGK